ncbi:hypothetical protein ACEZCY_35875 [Streptacidiphilus sp. N1-12]|uniref:Uncharacterized protein n=1 Tax=Streptacidiphilus alkalitolerans TaxID=3342712 RepID=A0ABV6WR91_9ACTN
MPTTATTPATFEDLARRHGKALAYIAAVDDNFTPADDPTSVDPDALITMVSYAASELARFRREDAADDLEHAETYLTEALKANDADRPALLKLAARHLADTYDMAVELAIDLGEERPF